MKNSQFDQNQLYWLNFKESLTEKLIDLTGGNFKVHCVSQLPQKTSVNDARLIGVTAGDNLLHRQAQLFCFEKLVIKACAVIEIKEDCDRRAIKAGEQYYAKPYFLDPAKWTLLARVGDMHDPLCNVYRYEVKVIKTSTVNKN